MNMKQLIFEIQKGIIKNDIEDVNSGGCGFFAFFVANELDKCNIPYKIKVVDDIIGGTDIEQKVANINNFVCNKEKPQSDLINFEHCYIQIEDYKFDAEISGEALNDKDYHYKGVYTKHDLKIALRYGDWSKVYYKKQNRLLRSVIRESFQTVRVLASLPKI